MDGVQRAKIIYAACKDFILTDDQCHSVLKVVESEICKGLSQETNRSSDIKCRLSKISDFLNGEEYGKFIGIDLGLYTVNIILIDNVNEEKDRIRKRKQSLGVDLGDEVEIDDFEITQMSFEIPKYIFNVKDGRKFYDYLVDCLDNFVRKFRMENEKLSLGFSFPFPSENESLTEATLISWTHHFNCQGVLGMDIGKHFLKAIRRQKKLKVNFIVVLNTICATLLAGMWRNVDCKIGLILDNVCNASYLERMENVDVYSMEEDMNNIIINTEWSALGENNSLEFIRTEIDKEMDQITNNKDFRIYEKMVSTVYLGELIRRILVNLMEAGAVFNDKYSEMLLKPWTFVQEDIFEIESDKPGKYEKCRRVLRRFELRCISDTDCATVRFVCQTITTRSAHLIACGLIALLHRFQPDQNHVIAIQGALYRDHPKYAELVYKKMKKLAAENYAFELFVSPDVFGLGAALLAAIYYRIHFNTDDEEEEYLSSDTEIVSETQHKGINCEVELDP